jgi:hypothetical protein
VHEGTTSSSIHAPAASLAGIIPRTPPALLVALALLALLLPVRSAQQAIFAGSFALALWTFGLWGHLFGRLVLGVPRLGPCSAVYLGQFAALAAAAPVMAANGLAAGAVGKSLPLVALVAPATLALIASRPRAPRPPVGLDLFALLALASVGLVVSIYSAHVSALGLDLHEHTAWIRQIVARGYVPLAEPGTGILADYPRGFHVLTGLWNAAGLSLPAGPFAKAMPFLQNASAVLALGEQVVDAQAQRTSSARRAWEIALGLAFYAYAFLLVPLVYPVMDLLGTPRFSSCGLLLLPVVLIMIARVRQCARAAFMALAAAPLLVAWALVWNPIVPVLFVVVTVPIAAALLLWLRPPRSEGFSRRGKLAAFAVCAALGVIVLVQDPWVVNLAAGRIPVCRSLVERAGLITFEEAVALGRATPREKSVRNAQPAPPCSDVRCVSALAGAAFRDALRLPLTGLRAGMGDLQRIALSPSLRELRDAFKGSLPFRPALVADYAGLPFVSFVAAGALFWAWGALRRRRLAPPGSDDGSRLLVSSLVGLAVAGVALGFSAGLAAALNDQRHESIILAGYLGVAGLHVSLGFLWLPFSAATVVLVAPLCARLTSHAREAGPPRSRRAMVLASAGLLLWIALPLLARLNLHLPIQHRGFWSPLGIEDLRALRQVEAAIPASDGVIVPAEHANVANWEHWVLPSGETAALLPYGERRYLFNVYLGASYPLSWRDLDERLCSDDPAIRSSFLERTGTRWALVRDLRAPDAAAALHEPRMCSGRQISLAALGAELPAIRERRGIFLFRVHRDSPGSAQPSR